MKKSIILMLTLLMALLLFSSTTAYADKLEMKSQATYVLPLSLKEIEEEAFSGTAVETVVFPEGFLQIGEKVFENAWHLADVYLPETTEYIADSAFFITPNLTIHGIDGSYTMDWAYHHKIPFVVHNVWNAIIQSGRTNNSQTDAINWAFLTIVLLLLFEFFRYSYCEVRSRRPQDRPELNPIDYRFP